MSISSVKQEITNAFPPTQYQGAVTPVDGEPFAEEIDDDLSLYERLRGRAWDSIEPAFIDHQYSGLSLLTEAAFVAFIPAWLTRALDFPGNDNIVREFVLYSLAGKVTGRSPDRLLLLTAAQRNAVRKFLEIISEIEPEESVRSEATIALEMLNNIG